MSIQEPITAPRASSLTFIYHGRADDAEREVVIPAPSLQKVADCLKLDPKTGGPSEGEKTRVLRLQKQAHILFGPEFAYLTDELTLAQCSELVQALYLAGIGGDPAKFVELLRFYRQQRQRSAEESLAEIENLIIELAAKLRITPEEAARMPVADAISLRAKLTEESNRDAHFEAALHDKKLS